MAEQVSLERVLSAVRELCPPRFALDGDKTGLQVGRSDRKIRRVLMTLDLTLEVAEEAAPVRDVLAQLVRVPGEPRAQRLEVDVLTRAEPVDVLGEDLLRRTPLAFAVFDQINLLDGDAPRELGARP